MGYVVGIDLGTTFSAAAVASRGRVDTFTLGSTSPVIPSVVLLREDGSILTGEAADRRATTEPARAAREFKRRLGDPVPIVLGGTPYGAEALMGHLLRAIVAQVTEREGEPADLVVLTHPANYTDFKQGLLEEAARQAGLDLGRLRFVSEPEAAAISYAAHQRIDPSEVVIVYDFGGGTFDTALVRRTHDGFELVGDPEGMERLGGIDLDQAVLAHVDESVDGMLSQLDANDPTVRTAMARLRADARVAKEALSSDTDTTMHLAFPGLQTDVRLTREEFEDMVRPRLRETIDALDRAVASAGLSMGQVSRVLLVGGSSRIPLVGQLVREHTSLPTSLDAHPKLTVATGAAHAFAADSRPPAPEAVPSRPTVAATQVITGPPPPPPAPRQASEPPDPPVSARPPRTDGAAPRRTGLVVGVGVVIVALVVAAVLGALALGGGDDDADGASTTGPTSPTATGPEGSTRGRGLEGLVTSVAGNGSDDGDGAPGAALAVSLGTPEDVAVAPNGDLYVVDGFASRLLRVNDGEVTEAYLGDSTIGESGFSGVAVSDDGEVVFGSGLGINRLDEDGEAELVIDAEEAELGNGYSFAFGPDGELFVGVSEDARVYRLEADDLVPVAGDGSTITGGVGPPRGDGGPALESNFGSIDDIAVSDDGVLYVADRTNKRVRQVEDGTITTVAGGGDVLAVESGRVASEGTPGTDLELSGPNAVAVDDDGRLYVGDPASRLLFRLGGERQMEAVIADVGGVTAQDDRPANETRVLFLGDIAVGDDVIYFVDGAVLRSIAPL